MPVALPHFRVRGAGKAWKRTSTLTRALGFNAKVATSVIENGLAVGPGPFTVLLMLVILVPVTVTGAPSGVPVPNSALVSSK